MKFWNVFLPALLVTLLITTPSLAQSPYYGYPFYGYPPRDIPYPYYAYPYYSYPNYSLPISPYYLQPSYVAPLEVSTMNTDLVINDLQTDVERLTNEVERLQNELTVVKTQPAQAYGTEEQASAPEPAPAPRPPSTPYTMILKDGRRIEAQGYVIAGDTLWIVTPEDSIRVALSDLNIDATRKENFKRGIDFPAV